MSDSVEGMQSTESAIDAAALGAIAAGGSDESEQATTENVPEIPTSEILFPVISLATNVLAPNWGISEDENRALSESYAALLDKYIPNVGGKFGVELNALIITGAILMPRLGKPRTLEPIKPENGESVAPEKDKKGDNDDLQAAAVNMTGTVH